MIFFVCVFDDNKGEVFIDNGQCTVASVVGEDIWTNMKENDDENMYMYNDEA